jgi:hypothetical protein
LTTWRPIFAVPLLVLLAACGSTPEQEPRPPSMDEMLARLTEQSGKTCVPFSDIKTHTALEDSLLSVSTRRGEHYLVTTMHPCRFLGSSSGTLVSDSWGMLCRGSSSVISTHDTSCSVRNVYKFDSPEAAMMVLEVARARREAAEQFPDLDR